MKFILNEDLFNDIPDVDYQLKTEQELEGPEPGIETGVSGLLLDTISKVAQNINDYNMLRANLNEYPEIDELIKDLADQENINLGKLQSALKSISPNAELIMNGAVETEEDFPLDEDYRTKDADELIEDAVKETLNFLIDNNIDFPEGEFSLHWEDWADAVNMGMTSLIEDAEVLKEFLEKNIPEQSDLIKDLDIAISNYNSIYESYTPQEADLYISNMESDIAKVLKDSGGDLDNFNGKIIESAYQQPKLLLSFNSTLFDGIDEKTFKAKAEDGLEKYLSTTKFYDVSYVSFIKADVPVPGAKSYDIEIKAYADSDDLD